MNTLYNICNKLNVDVAEMRIIDTKTTSEGDLVMVFPVENCSDELARAKGVRGSVWTVRDNDVVPVYGTLGYAEEYVADHISLRVDLATGANSVVLTNYHTGTSIILEVGVSYITMCNEGLVYRVTKDFKMNHRKIDAKDSTWGEAKYSTIFESLGLPSSDVLFSNGLPTDVCHTFMAVHRHTITGTRQVFEGDAGYIVYLGAVDENNNRAPHKDYPFPHMSFDDFPNVVTENLGVINPIVFTLDEANEFLNNGFYGRMTTNDQRIKTGESVILHTMNGDRIKIVSSGFHWRNSLREGSTSIPNQYYKLVHGEWDEQEGKDSQGRPVYERNGKARTVKVWNKQDFAAKFLPIDPSNVKTLKEFILNGGRYVYAEETKPFTEDQLKRYETDVYERARIVYFNYLLSLPLPVQREYVGLYDQYVADTDNLVEFIQMIRKGYTFYVDPRTLTSVGSTKQPAAEVQELFKNPNYRKGCDNRIFDLTEVIAKKPIYDELVLLKEPHPRIAGLVDTAVKKAEMQVRKKGFKNVSDTMMEEMIITNIRWLLAREHFNTRFQMTKQAYAWVKNVYNIPTCPADLATPEERAQRKEHESEVLGGMTMNTLIVKLATPAKSTTPPQTVTKPVPGYTPIRNTLQARGKVPVGKVPVGKVQETKTNKPRPNNPRTSKRADHAESRYSGIRPQPVETLEELM